MNRIISILLFIHLALGLGPLFAKNEATDSMGFSMGMDYTSDYIWRGMYRFNHDGAFFPFASLKLADLKLGYMGEYSEDYMTRKDKADTDSRLSDKKHTADFGLDFSHTFRQSLTLGAGVWYFHLLNVNKKDAATGSIFLSFDGIPFKPTIKYSHDYYIDSKKKMDFYIQFGMNKEFEIRNGGLTIGAMLGYFNANTLNKSGLSDLTTTLGINATITNVTFSGSFNFVWVPSQDFYKVQVSNGSSVEDKFRTFSTFSATLSI